MRCSAALFLFIPAVLEKYYQAQRELESLRHSIATEHEDRVETLEATKRSLEKKVCTTATRNINYNKQLRVSKARILYLCMP